MNKITTTTDSSQLQKIGHRSAVGILMLTTTVGIQANNSVVSSSSFQCDEYRIMDTWTLSQPQAYVFPQKKSFKERYRRIGASRRFKRTHDNMSLGDIIPIEE